MKNTVRNSVRALDAPGQRIGHGKGQNVYDDQAIPRAKSAVYQKAWMKGCPVKALVIVCQTDELGVSKSS